MIRNGVIGAVVAPALIYLYGVFAAARWDWLSNVFEWPIGDRIFLSLEGTVITILGFTIGFMSGIGRRD